MNADEIRLGRELADAFDMLAIKAATATDAEWAVIIWRCPHQHRFWLAKWLCVRLELLRRWLGDKNG